MYILSHWLLSVLLFTQHFVNLVLKCAKWIKSCFCTKSIFGGCTVKSWCLKYPPFMFKLIYPLLNNSVHTIQSSYLVLLLLRNTSQLGNRVKNGVSKHFDQYTHYIQCFFQNWLHFYNLVYKFVFQKWQIWTAKHANHWIVSCCLVKIKYMKQYKTQCSYTSLHQFIQHTAYEWHIFFFLT